jgi:hypothetical protein
MKYLSCYETRSIAPHTTFSSATITQISYPPTSSSQGERIHVRRFSLFSQFLKNIPGHLQSLFLLQGERPQSRRALLTQNTYNDEMKPVTLRFVENGKQELALCGKHICLFVN